MRALELDTSGLRLVTRSDIAAEQADAIVEVDAVAVCSRDLRASGGESCVPGHAVVGRVASNVAGHARGERVVIDPDVVCGTCQRCRSGLSAHCSDRRRLGTPQLDGGLAELVVVPARNLVPVPDDVDDDHAVFSVALATALGLRRQFVLEPRCYLSVLGETAAALLLMQLLGQEVPEARYVGRVSGALDLCAQWSIPHRPADDIGRRADQDVVIADQADAGLLMLALELLRPRGTFVCSQDGTETTSLNVAAIADGELLVRGARGGPLGEAVALLARRAVEVVGLINRRASFDSAVAALGALSTAAPWEHIVIRIRG